MSPCARLQPHAGSAIRHISPGIFIADSGWHRACCVVTCAGKEVRRRRLPLRHQVARRPERPIRVSVREKTTMYPHSAHIAALRICRNVRKRCSFVGLPQPRKWQLSENDRALAPGESLLPGTRVVTPRRGYRHHGIYVGRGKVVHYGGLVRGLHRGPVEEVSLEKFTNGRPLWVRYESSCCFDPDEVIRRALSRVGEDCYRLLTNNCEHFCEWCLRAEHRSYQVDEWLLRPHRALRMTASCVHVRAVMFVYHVQTLLRGAIGVVQRLSDRNTDGLSLANLFNTGAKSLGF